MTSILNNKTYVVLLGKPKSSDHVAGLRYIDRIRNKAPKLAWLCYGSKRIATLVLKPWHHERRRPRLANSSSVPCRLLYISDSLRKCFFPSQLEALALRFIVRRAMAGRGEGNCLYQVTPDSCIQLCPRA